MLDVQTLIFDFGSEIYVWSGRNARKTTGRYAVEYAQQLVSKLLCCFLSRPCPVLSYCALCSYL